MPQFPEQPPSGGCELKLSILEMFVIRTPQPPSGGCELKPFAAGASSGPIPQPPSGGCELKPPIRRQKSISRGAAAFGRL